MTKVFFEGNNVFITITVQKTPNKTLSREFLEFTIIHKI